MTRFACVYEDEVQAEMARLVGRALPGVELPELVEYSAFRRHDGDGRILPYIDYIAVFDSAPWGERLGTYVTFTLEEPEPPAGCPRPPATFILEAVEVELEALEARIWTPETGEWRDEPGLRPVPPLPDD